MRWINNPLWVDERNFEVCGVALIMLSVSFITFYVPLSLTLCVLEAMVLLWPHSTHWRIGWSPSSPKPVSHHYPILPIEKGKPHECGLRGECFT